MVEFQTRQSIMALRLYTAVGAGFGYMDASGRLSITGNAVSPSKAGKEQPLGRPLVR